MTKYNEYEIEDKILEEARERDHKKRNIIDNIEVFSINDMW